MIPEQIKGIDRNLRALKAIENTWGHGPMPDLVKLDIATMSNMDVRGIQAFASGLGKDLTKRQTMRPKFDVPTIQYSSDGETEENNFINQTDVKISSQQRRDVFLRGLAGLDPPTEVSPNSVLNWKERAVDLGYLSPDIPMDNTWDPAYNPILGQMRMDDFNRAVKGGGNNMTSLPIMRDEEGGSSVMKFLEDWFTPTGALRAATELGFMWDFDKIKNEWSDSKKGFWQKLWGTLDDALMPVVNIGLMFVGVGEMRLAATAVLKSKKLMDTTRGIKVLSLADDAIRLGKAGQVGRQGNLVSRALGRTTTESLTTGIQAGGRGTVGYMEGLVKPGYIASKMGGSQGAVRQGLSKGMDRWRNLRPVVLGKQAVGQTMRIGTAQRVQQAIGLDQGTSLEYWAPGASAAIQKTSRNLALELASDVFFMPVQVFGPGQLTAIPGAPIRWANRKLTTIARDSAFVKGTSRVIERHFDKFADEVTGEITDPVMKQRFDDYVETTKTKGEAHATAQFLGYNLDNDVDAAAFGQELLWLATRAAIDEKAYKLLSNDQIRQSLNALDKDPIQVFRLKNQLSAELKFIDPEDMNDVIRTRHWIDAQGDEKEFNKLMNHFESLDDGYDPLTGKYDAAKDEKLKAYENQKTFVAAHNDNRAEKLKDLMDNHFGMDIMEAYVGKHLDQIGDGDWGVFHDITKELTEAVGAGRLADAMPVPIKNVSPMDMRVSGVSGPEAWVDDATRNFTVSLEDLFLNTEFRDFQMSRSFAPFLKPFNRHGAFTVAKQSTPVKQDLVRLSEQIKRLQFLETTVAQIKIIKDADIKKVQRLASDVLKAKGKKFVKHLTDDEIKNVLATKRRVNSKSAMLSAEEQRRITRIIKHAKKMDEDITVDQVFKSVEADVKSRIKEIDESTTWVTNWNIDQELSLADKVKKLQLRKNSTASAIDHDSITDPEARKLLKKLEDKGYKLVYGVEFAQPNDLKGLDVSWEQVFDDKRLQRSLGLDRPWVSKMAVPADWARKKGYSYGQSFHRKSQRFVHSRYQAAMQNSLSRNLREIKNPDHPNRDWNLTNTNYVDVLLQDLNKVLRKIQDDARITFDAKETKMVLGKVLANATTARTPQSPLDLVSPFQRKRFLAEMRKLKTVKDGVEVRRYSDAELNAIHAGLKESRVIGEDVRGSITHWEDKFRSKPVLMRAMQLTLAPTQYAGQGGGKAQAVRQSISFTTRGIAGGAAGAIAGTASSDDPDSSVIDIVWGGLAGASGFFAGRGAANALMSRNWGKRFKQLQGFNKIFDQKLAENHNKVFGNIFTRNGMKIGTNPQKVINPFKVVAARYERKMLDPDSYWKDFAYLADTWSALRDHMRFSMSPIFDASRYTEAYVLGQTGVTDKAIRDAGGLRYNMSPTAWQNRALKNLTGVKRVKNAKRMKGTFYRLESKKGRTHWLTEKELNDQFNLLPDSDGVIVNDNITYGEKVKSDWNAIVDEFSEVQRSRGDYDFDALEAGTARFTQVGLLGFNTQAWEASMYADLTRLYGMEKRKAYEVAKKAYAYGVDPRSPAEMNVNAVFFPFSFMKKIVGHTSEFLMDDWSRVGMLHAGLKTYETLDDNYDLDEFFRDRMPLLQRFQRLNVYAYGISPGEFGGANRPLIDWFNSTPVADGVTNPIANLFSPIGIHPETTGSADNFFKDMERLLPVLNDMQHLIDDAASQGYVIMSGIEGREWLTAEAEAEVGFAEVNALRESIDMAIKMGGEPDGIAALGRKEFSNFKEAFDEAKIEIGDRYPGYRAAVAEVAGYAIERSGEEQRYMREAAAVVSEGAKNWDDFTNPREQIGVLLLLSDRMIENAGGYEFLTPAQITAFFEIATPWVKGSDYVRVKWRKHFRRIWGPMETEIRL